MDKRSRDAKVAAAAQPQSRPSSARPLPPPPPPLHSRAPPPITARPRFEPVDREKIGSHHSEEDFAVRGKEPKDEVQIYTWKDATLRELTDLMISVLCQVKEVAPEARRRNAKLSFAFVYPDQRGRFVLRTVGMTHAYGNGRRVDDSKSLGELSFQRKKRLPMHEVASLRGAVIH
ncbi:Histone deacetylase complex subunit SAP18 [Morella rubra]|uniref:Histone deacetylase complex subunit SAP18 n=1 Tax=Morella rubra TaxID=262757 RepID=A0A6A1W020_9ROSI|nr:Histone deacetylase complex subunit SAP18 [Morella rubra]